VANADGLDNKQTSSDIRRFIGAVSRGVKYLKHNQAGAVDALLKANPDLDPALQRASVKVTLPALMPAGGKPFGWQDPAQWGAFATWMHENGILKKANATGAFTNELLPGQGL
jgi:putative hydroxymethylpyrimidine transport system substrate-binding protein